MASNVRIASYMHVEKEIRLSSIRGWCMTRTLECEKTTEMAADQIPKSKA
jgi:hypothetical protein